MKAAAMPSWFALSAVAVASARSFCGNHVAERSGGLHWKKGWLRPTSTVPARIWE